MILLNDIHSRANSFTCHAVVEIFDLQNFDQPAPAVLNQLAIHVEKTRCVRPAFVDCPAKIGPLAFNPDISFICYPAGHPLGFTCGTLPAMSPVSDGSYVFFDPPIGRCVFHGDAALGHEFF